MFVAYTPPSAIERHHSTSPELGDSVVEIFPGKRFQIIQVEPAQVADPLQLILKMLDKGGAVVILFPDLLRSRTLLHAPRGLASKLRQGNLQGYPTGACACRFACPNDELHP